MGNHEQEQKPVERIRGFGYVEEDEFDARVRFEILENACRKIHKNRQDLESHLLYPHSNDFPRDVQLRPYARKPDKDALDYLAQECILSPKMQSADTLLSNWWIPLLFMKLRIGLKTIKDDENGD